MTQPFLGRKWRSSYANTGTPNRRAFDLSDGENSLSKLDLISKFPYIVMNIGRTFVSMKE